MEPSLVAWGEEAMVKPYQTHGPHDAAWDDLALQLIRGNALELAGSPASPGEERLGALAAMVRRSGCNDPWVLFLARRLGEADPDFAEVMAKSASSVADAGYSPFPVWLTRAEALRAAQRDNPAAAGALVTGCLEALSAALSEKPLGEGDYRVWCQMFLKYSGACLLKQDGEGVCHVVESLPGAAEWFQFWMRGRSEIEQAWLARGEGWANSVKPEQWEQFSHHLANARTSLEQSWKLQPRPETARSFMTVELGSGGIEGMRRRFDDATRLRFDYLPAYDSLRSGLEPRWFGSGEALLAFGRTCLATRRFDTEVPWQMMKAVQDIASDQDDSDLYYKNQVPWSEVLDLLDGYLAHGNPARRNYYLSVKAVLSAIRGLDDNVARLLKQLDYKIDPQVKEEWNLSVEWVGRMAALSGPSADLTLAAQKQESANPKMALESLLAAQKLPGLLPVTSTYLAGRVAEVRSIIALSSATWRPLTPPENLSGWKVERGEWKVVSPTLLEAKTTAATGALITCLQPIGETCELRGEFNVVGKGPERAEAALFCGPAGNQEEQGFSLRFWTRPYGWSGISLARGFGEDAFSKKTGFEETIPFLIRLTNARVRVREGKFQWLADQPLPKGVVINSAALLGLGTTSPGESTVQFRNLEIRTASEQL